MKKNLATEAGPTSSSPSGAHVDAINQVFAIFRRNFHNQYFKAFADEKELNITKRLWLDSLLHFSADNILLAAKKIIETKEFLPTLHTMIEYCKKVNSKGFPEVHAAYMEACQAPSPKANASWSHPIVYYAGKACDWYFLQNNTEKTAFPVFKEKYLELCERINLGEVLPKLNPLALPEENNMPVDKKKNIENLQSLKDALDI